MLLLDVSDSLPRKACAPTMLTTTTADLKCVIDLITAPGTTSDTTSDLEIRQAAHRVINECVRQPGPTSGGSVGAVGRSTLFLGDS